MDAETQYESAQSQPELGTETHIGNTPDEDKYFSPRPDGGRPSGNGDHQLVDEEATQEWTDGIFVDTETQAMESSPKSQKSEGSKTSKSPSGSQRAQSEQGDGAIGNALPSEPRDPNLQRESSSESSPTSKYFDVNVDDQGGVTPDPVSARMEMNLRNQAMMMMRSKTAVNEAINVAKKAFGPTSQESIGKVRIEHEKLPSKDSSSSSSGSGSGSGGYSVSLRATKESALATVFATLNPEIRKVVTEVIEPSSSAMSSRLQRFRRKAEHTASTEDQAQPFLQHRTTYAARNALSVFDQIDPKALGLAEEAGLPPGTGDVTATSPFHRKNAMQNSPVASHFKSKGGPPGRAQSSDPPRTHIGRLRITGSLNGSVLPQFAITEPPNPDLPQVGPGMFSVLARKDGTEAGTPVSAGDLVAAETDDVLGKAAGRRRFLVRPGAESQEALRIAGEQALAMASDAGLSGSFVRPASPKKKTHVGGASGFPDSPVRADPGEDAEGVPKRKRGRPPKKRRGGLVNTGPRQQGRFTNKDRHSSISETAADSLAASILSSSTTSPIDDTMTMEEAALAKQAELDEEAAAPVPATIAFSGIEPEPALMRGLPSASVVDNPEHATHLVMGGEYVNERSSSGRATRKSKAPSNTVPGKQVRLKRTPKLLVALNNGVQNVVCLQWLIDSAEAGHVLPLNASDAQASTSRKSSRRAAQKAPSQVSVAGANALLYIMQDAEKEKLYGFSMLYTLAQQQPGRNSRVFANLAFYVTPDVLGVSAPSREEFDRIITSAGGLFLGDRVLSAKDTVIPAAWVAAMQEHQSLAIVVLSTDDGMSREPHLPSWLASAVDSSGSAALRGLSGKVLSSEFVYVSILRQQLALQESKREMVLQNIPS